MSDSNIQPNLATNDGAAPQAVATVSLGIFGAGCIQPPGACLTHCLEGNPALAETHGCAMVKALAKKWNAAAKGIDTAEQVSPPAVCGKGYHVRLDPPTNPSPLEVLQLAARNAEDHALQSALMEQAIQLVRENAHLNIENNGLADEVLRIYEQINLIFDVSAQIAILNDADEVRRMLLKKLRHMLNADAVFMISPDEKMIRQINRNDDFFKMFNPGTDTAKEPARGGKCYRFELPPEYADARQRLRRSPRVFVFEDQCVTTKAGHGTSMWGPISDDQSAMACIGIVRRGTPFQSGDMLLLDSTLTFGGHILSNLKLVDQLKQTNFETVRALVSAIDQKDNYTYGHSERVGFLSKATGQHMGLSPRHLQELEWAGMLHDVGKIGIPEVVLNKPGKLTDEEFAIIKEHPQRSYDVLKPVASLEPVLKGVLHHHENPDGTGYPAGLVGEDIPLYARIIHVVDVFDALTSTRSYRGAFDVGRAIEILEKDAGTKLDADIVREFLGTWQALPHTHPEEYQRWFGEMQEKPA